MDVAKALGYTYFDLFMATDTLTNIRNTAKEIRIPEKLFTYLLVDLGFVYRHGGRLWSHSFMVHYGYTTLKDYVSGKHGGTYMLFTPLGKIYPQKNRQAAGDKKYEGVGIGR